MHFILIALAPRCNLVVEQVCQFMDLNADDEISLKEFTEAFERATQPILAEQLESQVVSSIV